MTDDGKLSAGEARLSFRICRIGICMPPDKESKIFLVEPSNLDEEAQPLELQVSSSEVDKFELPARLSAAMVYVLTGLLLTVLIWSAIASVDVVAEAPGQVIPAGHAKAIRPIADGVVERLFVQEGESVKAGSRLALLERTKYSAEVEKFSKDLEIAKIELGQHEKAARALEEAISNPEQLPELGVELTDVREMINNLYNERSRLSEAQYDASAASVSDRSSPALAALKRRHQQLSAEQSARQDALSARSSEYKIKTETKEREIAEKKRLVESAKAELKKLDQVVKQTKEQAEAYQKVFKLGAVSRVDYLGMLKHLEEMELNALKQQSLISSLGHQVEAATNDLSEFKAQAQANLSERQAEIKRLASEITAIEMQIRDNTRQFNLTKSSYAAALERAESALEKQKAEVVFKQKRIRQIESQLAAASQAYELAELKSPIGGIVTN